MEPEPGERRPRLGPSGSDLLAEFLGSEVVLGIEYIAPADIRAVAERFFQACRDLGLEPNTLLATDLRAVLETRLPVLYAPSEPLGQRTIDVLRTFLAFLGPSLGRDRARSLGRTLEDCAEPFRTRIRCQ